MKRNEWDECEEMIEYYISGRVKREKPREKPTRLRFGIHMEWPRRELGTSTVGGQCPTAFATKPHKFAIFQYSTRLNLKSKIKVFHYFCCLINNIGDEGWSEFPDLWSSQKPWWNWYLIPVANFGEVRRAQLAKSTLLTSTLVLLGYFQIFYGMFRW